MLSNAKIRLLATTVALCAATHAWALERVTLRNGFSYDCARHESTPEGQVRLYFAAKDGTATGGYIERPSIDIADIEILPDPPKPVVTATPTVTTPVLAAGMDVHSLLQAAGQRFRIDADLLEAIMHAESGGQVHAVSRAGAQGLMQLMPGTAKAHGVTDSFQPDQNIHGGAAYLDELLNKYYNPKATRYGLDLVLAAYNAGPAAVDRYHGVPPFAETRAYVSRVEREYARRVAVREHAQATTSIASVAR